MCLVVDTNSRGRFLSDDEPAALLRHWVESGRGKLLHIDVGRWRAEHHSSSAEWQQQVQEYERNGFLKIVAKGKFDAALKDLPEKIKSDENEQKNDRHVLALACAGGARLLYSADKNLRDDFKVTVDGGKIYPGVGGQSDSNPKRTPRRCREVLRSGGLCDRGA